MWPPHAVNRLKSIPELAAIPRDEMHLITLSAGGATIMIESANVYIELAALMLSELERTIKNNKPGNLIIDFLQEMENGSPYLTRRDNVRRLRDHPSPAPPVSPDQHHAGPAILAFLDHPNHIGERP